MSSANILAVALTKSGRSFTYNRNSNGQRIEPCGTPLLTFFHDELPFLRSILSLLPARKDWIHNSALPLILYCVNL